MYESMDSCMYVDIYVYVYDRVDWASININDESEIWFIFQV